MTNALNPAVDEASVRSFGFVLVGSVTHASTPHLVLRTHIIEADEEPLFGSSVEALSTVKTLRLDDLCGNQPLAVDEVLTVRLHRVVVDPAFTHHVMEIRK